MSEVKWFAGVTADEYAGLLDEVVERVKLKLRRRER